jgi:heptosyltransferase-1
MTTRTGPRILLCRLSAVGDCILTLPLLCALREQFPDSHLSWVVQPGPASLLRGHGCLDELVIVPKHWYRSWRGIQAVRRQLQALRCEIALDPQSLSKSAALAWLSGAQVRIGFGGTRGRELAPWLNRTRVVPTATHLVDCQLELLRPLGISTTPDVTFQLPRDAQAEAAIEAWMQHVRLDRRFMVINPGAGWDSRLWPVERYAEVARQLGKGRQIPSVTVWAGSRERAWAEQIVSMAGGHALLAPETTLPELAALLRRTALFLGSDTGPLHLAAAAGATCVGLYGPTRPECSGAYGSRHLALQAAYQSGTSRQRRQASNATMCAIDVPAVVEACQQLLDDHASSWRFDRKPEPSGTQMTRGSRSADPQDLPTTLRPQSETA